MFVMKVIQVKAYATPRRFREAYDGQPAADTRSECFRAAYRFSVTPVFPDPADAWLRAVWTTGPQLKLDQSRITLLS